MVVDHILSGDIHTLSEDKAQGAHDSQEAGQLCGSKRVDAGKRRL